MSPSELRVAFVAGWEGRSGRLRPPDVPGVLAWILAVVALGTMNPSGAARLALATLAIWGVLRGVWGLRRGWPAAAVLAAHRLGEITGAIGSLDRRAWAGMDAFDARWDDAVDGAWAWWLAMVAGPVVVACFA